MRPSEALHFHRDRVRAIALGHRVRSVRVFGSVARGRDGEHSDLDLLVEPTDETTLFDLGAIQAKVSELLRVEVDVLTPESLPDRFRAQVLSEAHLL